MTSPEVAYALYHALIAAGHASWCQALGTGTFRERSGTVPAAPARSQSEGTSWCRCGRNSALLAYEGERVARPLSHVKGGPGMSLLVLAPPSDQLGHDFNLVLLLEAGEREPDQGRGADPERSASPGVGENSIKPARLVKGERDRGFPFLRPGLRVANSSCHAGSIARRLPRFGG